MEMGFDEKEVVDALRVNNNQQDAAVGTQNHIDKHTQVESGSGAGTKNKSTHSANLPGRKYFT